MTIESDVQRLDPGALVDMFVLDTTPIAGQSAVYYFHPGVNGLGNDVTWQGQVYSRWPCEIDGLEKRGTGTNPRPTIKVANITGFVSAMNKAAGDMIGARITRKRTFVKYLDAINFPGSFNPTADSSVHFPDEIYFVDRKAAQNNVVVQYELASAMDLQGFMLPARQVIQNICTWTYRGTECGYAGGPVADINDRTPPGYTDACSRHLAGCKLRFGLNQPLPFGGFPGCGLIR